jgi:hypothetical protein
MIDIIKYIGSNCTFSEFLEFISSVKAFGSNFTRNYANRHIYRYFDNNQTNLTFTQMKNCICTFKPNADIYKPTNCGLLLIKYYSIENEKGNVIEEDWFEIRKYVPCCKIRLHRDTDYLKIIIDLLAKQIEYQNTTINLLSKQISNFEKKFLHIPKKS